LEETAKLHIWHNIYDLYLKMSTALTLFTSVVLSKNNKILIIINLAFHSFFLRTTASATRKLDSRGTQNSFHMFNKRYLSWFKQSVSSMERDLHPLTGDYVNGSMQSTKRKYLGTKLTRNEVKTVYI
jgi:hypothetical protein